MSNNTVPAGLSRAVFVAACSLVPVLSACRSSTEPADVVCRTSSQSDSYGCADLQVAIEGGVVAIPSKFSVEVRVRPARQFPGVPWAFADAPRFGSNALRLDLTSPLEPSGTDTLSVWAVAKLLDQSNANAGVLVAADSALVPLKFAPIGKTPTTYPVRLTLRT